MSVSPEDHHDKPPILRLVAIDTETGAWKIMGKAYGKNAQLLSVADGRAIFLDTQPDNDALSLETYSVSL